MQTNVATIRSFELSPRSSSPSLCFLSFPLFFQFPHTNKSPSIFSSLSSCHFVGLCALIVSSPSCNSSIPLHPSSSLPAYSVCLSSAHCLLPLFLLSLNPTCPPLYCTSHVSISPFFVYLTLSLQKPRGYSGLTLIDAWDRGEGGEGEGWLGADKVNSGFPGSRSPGGN